MKYKLMMSLMCVGLLASSLPASAHLPHPPARINAISISQRNMVKRRIIHQFNNWKGVKYQWGGTTHNGVDCSALVRNILKASSHKALPRTTGEQIEEGYSVIKNRLQPGDLVFFQTSKTTRHVGIYIGNDQFVHASSSKGVTISSLSNIYWQQHYETARRVLS